MTTLFKGLLLTTVTVIALAGLIAYLALRSTQPVRQPITLRANRPIRR